jgi:hypothetical protein
MMKEELEQRLGYPIEPWQWEMANYIYMNHPDIPDVGGKDVIARKILDGGGFESKSVVRREYEDMGGPPIIVKTKRTLCETYDVTHENYCINTRGNKLYDIFKEVKGRLEKEYPELMAHCDYFAYDGEDLYKEEKYSLWDLNDHWLAIHYVTGGSEGYYVHVARVDRQNRYKIIFLAKTLNERDAGITWAANMVAALSRIMEV